MKKRTKTQTMMSSLLLISLLGLLPACPLLPWRIDNISVDEDDVYAGSPLTISFDLEPPRLAEEANIKIYLTPGGLRAQGPLRGRISDRVQGCRE